MTIYNLQKTALILVIIIAIVAILVFAKPFLVPITIAALLSMLLLPVSKWLQGKGVHQLISIVLSILLLLIGTGLIFGLIAWQISDLTSQSSEFEKQITDKYHQVQEFIATHLGISKEKQQQMKQQSQSSTPGKISGFIMELLKGAGSFLTDTILVVVYIFLFIYFRGYFKRFIMRLVPVEEQSNAQEVMVQVQKVSQKYLGGLALMILLLWVMYGIGFAIAGVKHFVLFAILCGTLEIVPFIGNLIGTSFTLLMSLMQGGSTDLIIAIILTYGIVQFIQTYLIEPMVVGSEVNLNPVFTILGLVAGELIWGIGGMVLAIPLLGITKIICDHVDPLKPIGELIGKDKENNESGIKTKFKNFWKKLKGD